MSRETRVKIVMAVALVATLGALYAADPRWVDVLSSGDAKAIIRYIRSYGAWAMAVSFALDVLVNALGFLPSIFISTANGIVFGVWRGVLVSWLAETVGVVVSFFLLRTYLRESAERLLAKSPYLSRLDEMSRHGFKFMLIARTIPYFPSGILTALGAVSKITARDYMLANLLGKFPSTALEVIIGHDAVLYERHLQRLALIVVAATLVYGALWWWQRKHQRDEQAPADS